MRLAASVRWLAMLSIASLGLVTMVVLTARVAGDTPTQVSLARVTWAFAIYWASVTIVRVVVSIRWLIRGGHKLREFLGTVRDDEDRAELASILGPLTRWRRRVATACASALIVGLAALGAMTWGTTPNGVWEAITESNQPHDEVLPHLDVVLPAMLWWFLLAAGVFWICLLAFGLGLPTIPARFNYRSRSHRLGLAAATGARRGLTTVAYVVQLTPVVLLAYAGMRANPTLLNFLQGLLPNALLDLGDGGIAAIVSSPVQAAIILGSLPIALLVLLNRLLRPMTALDAGDWSLSTDVAPILYLRTWNADRVRLTLRGLRRGLLEHLDVPRSASLAEVVGTSLELIAPVVATAEPGGPRLLGVGSLWSTDQEWRTNVETRARTALCVVMTSDAVITDTGFSWEVEAIGSGRLTDRIVLVVPPGTTAGRLQKPNGFFYEIASLPMFRGLDTQSLSDDTLVVVRDADGTWFPLRSSIRTDIGYYLCIMDAVDRRQNEWERSASPAIPDDPRIVDVLASVSEDRFARDAATEGSLAVWRLRAFHKLATTKLGRKYLAWLRLLGD